MEMEMEARGLARALLEADRARVADLRELLNVLTIAIESA
jgi:hypothetical protein